MPTDWTNPDSNPLEDIKKVADDWASRIGIPQNYLVIKDKKIIFYSPTETTHYTSKWENGWQQLDPPLARQEVEEIYGKENVKFSYLFSYYW